MSNIPEIIRQVLHAESAAIDSLARQVDDSFVNVLRQLDECEGRLIVTGMGKMSQIARKAVATFCSTGSPAVFLHPGEAAHGDLGIVTAADVLIALSNSGETEEVNALIPFMRRFSVPVIAITGNPNSTLARLSDHTIHTQVEREADPISMAPTTSTTVTLAVCDALAIALMTERGFTAEQFAIFHPGGLLGRKLLLTVEQLMHVGDRIPMLTSEHKVAEAIVTVSEKGLGAVLIVDQAGQLVGIFTDGDLRRTLENSKNPLADPVKAWMTQGPVVAHPTTLAAEALRTMELKEITVLPVVDNQELVGIIHLHDLIRSGLA